MTAVILFRLTLHSIVSDIPHDFAAFVTYALLAAFAGLVVIGGRSGGQAPTRAPDAPAAASKELPVREPVHR